MSDLEPDSTAERTALWRALHVLADPPPHVLTDTIGLELAAPGDGWRRRPDMDPDGTRQYRAGIVARSRFTEDLLTERAGQGATQYVLLGAGLDTFTQRRPDLAARLRVFEVDQPGPQAWKRQRLEELGYPVPALVPVDFETGDWWERLAGAGFDPRQPAVVASLGVSMYLTKASNETTLRRLARLAPGSVVAMTFMPPLDRLDAAVRAVRQDAEAGARGSGTPFVSFYPPEEILALARDAGFTQAEHVSAAMLNDRYFAGRDDGLRTSSGEEILLAAS